MMLIHLLVATMFAVALSKCLALTEVSPNVFGNALNVDVFTVLRTKSRNNLTWCCLEIFVLVKLQRYIHIDS